MTAKRKRRTQHRVRGHYDLGKVKTLVREGKVAVTRNATESAYRDFEWSLNDIHDALLKLLPGHYYKSECFEKCPTIVLDYYKAHGLKGENVYIHFWIDHPDWLIVNSFKRIR